MGGLPQPASCSYRIGTQPCLDAASPALKPPRMILRLFLTLLVASFSLHAAEVKPLRALMICGGCCHDFTAQKTIISEGISARANVVWTIHHEPGDARTNEVALYAKPDWAAGYDVVVHNECFGFVTNVAFIEGIAAAHKAGVPAVLLHCSTHSYRMAPTDAWREVVGQKSMSHEKGRDLEIKNLKPEHPVMKGFPMTWLDKADELYKNEKLWPDFVPLAESYGVETKKTHAVVWLNKVGKGRVFGTTLGHSNATMSDPVYLDLVTRGLLWACDKLDENGKPKPGFAAKAK